MLNFIAQKTENYPISAYVKTPVCQNTSAYKKRVIIFLHSLLSAKLHHNAQYRSLYMTSYFHFVYLKPQECPWTIVYYIPRNYIQSVLRQIQIVKKNISVVIARFIHVLCLPRKITFKAILYIVFAPLDDRVKSILMSLTMSLMSHARV